MVVTSKDLVEANAFSSRRLAAAFVSGASAGHDLEPARPGRTIAGGLAISTLLLAGTVLAGALASADEEDGTTRPDSVLSGNDVGARASAGSTEVSGLPGPGPTHPVSSRTAPRMAATPFESGGG